jgi:hypothetical protein
MSTTTYERIKRTNSNHDDLKILDTNDVAKMAGLQIGSMRVLSARARDRRAVGQSLVTDLPAPDGYVGRSPIWKPETIQEWIEVRSEYGLAGRPPKSAKRSAGKN